MQSIAEVVTTQAGQTVLVRCNFDVPIDSGIVQDTTRLEDALPTIILLCKSGARVILLAHAGRPDGAFNQRYSLKPIVPFLESRLHTPVCLIPYVSDFHQLSIPHQPVTLLDNLRFYPEEEANDPEFALFLSHLANAYVNEAFANCHRKHASMVGLPKIMAGHAYAGISLAKEIAILDRVTKNPDHPFIVVIGGAKVETKEPLVTALAPKADHVLVGGKIAADLKSHAGLPANVELAELTPDGKDITEGSARHFADLIRQAKTVMWNGTLGLFEDLNNRQGTTIVAQAVNDTSAYTLIGGGDTETALTILNLEAGIDYISTGGGAMLTYLSEGHLTALDALNG